MTHLDAYILAAAECDTDAKRACCSFAKRIEELVHGVPAVDRADNKLWNLWPVTGDPWGPVTACEKAGLSVGLSRVSVGVAHPLEPGTHRVQGWRGKPFAAGVTGHTITVHVPPSGDKVMVFDSAAKDRAGNLRGPRATLVDWSDYSAQFKGGIASCRLKEV